MKSASFLALILALAACQNAPERPGDGSPPARAQMESSVAPPIIDMHMHADLDLIRLPAGTPLVCVPECPPVVATGALVGEAALKGTLEAMERHNIVKGFLGGDNLDTVRRWVTAGNGRFIGAPQVWEPGTPAVNVLRAEYAAKRLSGMGEIATQYTNHAPNDPAVEPYFALAEELDLPVLIHTLGIGAPLPGFRSAAGNPLLLEDVLVRHPKLRLFVENAGYPFLSEMIAMMTQYPQLYADVSTITWIIPRDAFHDYLQGLIRAGLGRRIMFGSDQMQWPGVIGAAIEAINSAKFLSETQKRDIFHNNAARFLRLETRQKGRPAA
jgi:predicted TIM-barrel fold metal-dependent hydrolase